AVLQAGAAVAGAGGGKTVGAAEQPAECDALCGSKGGGIGGFARFGRGRDWGRTDALRPVAEDRGSAGQSGGAGAVAWGAAHRIREGAWVVERSVARTTPGVRGPGCADKLSGPDGDQRDAEYQRQRGGCDQ